jgi:hypothetical protein
MDIVNQLLASGPSFHSSGNARWDCLPETLRFIQRHVQPGFRTLETGAGASTVVFASQGARHKAISPDGEEHERIRDYCMGNGIDTSSLETIVGSSDDVLPTLGRERSYDFILIDGDHTFPLPVVDWHYAARILKIGGMVLMDDVPIPAVLPVFSHMDLEPNWRLVATPDNRAAVFTLIAPPTAYDWKEQPFNRGYPDYSFIPFVPRVRATAMAQAEEWRGALGRRFPRLRQAYKDRTASRSSGASGLVQGGPKPGSTSADSRSDETK